MGLIRDTVKFTLVWTKIVSNKPASTTARVCAEVPEAMLVRAHAASNCRDGLAGSLK